MSSDYRTPLAAVDLTEALLHLNPQAPFSHIGETQLAALRQIATLFQDLLEKPGAPPRVVHT